MRYNRRLLLSLAAAIEILTLTILPLFLLASSSSSSEPNNDNSHQYHHNNNNNNRRTQRIAPLNIFFLIKDKFDLHRSQIENFVFQSLHHFSTTELQSDFYSTNTNGKKTLPSRLYTYDDFFNTLQTMSAEGILGNSFHKETNPYKPNKAMGSNDYMNDESNMAFYLSQDQIQDFDTSTTGDGMTLAIVNICAFLANVMVESIQFDTCDELNGMMTGFDTFTATGWGGSVDGEQPISLSDLSAVNGRYFPLSNACGQNGESYQEEEGIECTINDVDVSCVADPLMDMRATIHPKYNYIPGKQTSEGFRNQPPPEFACGKKDYEGDYPGYWDGYSAEFVQDVAYPSAGGRIDVEGCCFWGRGALQTKGTCALGKFNYYFGKRAYEEGRPARYPDVDFCNIPATLCNTNVAQYGGVVYPELKWIVALHQWIEGVQSYSNDETKWEYLPQLKLLVERGLTKSDVKFFIDKVSSVVTRGCDEYFCSTHTINFLEQRRENFETLIYDIFKLGDGGRFQPAPPITYNYEYVEKWLHLKRPKIEGNIFTSKHHELGRVQYYSQAFRFLPFISALRTSAKYGVGDGRYFFVVDQEEGLRGFNAGLVNLAAFLANAMAESIDHDSCEEFHWEKDLATGRYAISNSCGQNGRNYGTESCPPWQSFMTCPASAGTSLQASIPETSEPPFRLGPKPPPFECKPKVKLSSSGFWEESTNTIINNTTYPNSYGRTDIEGCSFWGRGALHTRGSCNFGKFNFHVGSRAAAENRPSLYPDLDFCSDPGLICTDEERTMDIRWVVGMFEWVDRVQDYYDSTLDWNYMRELYKYVDGGMSDDSFIEKVNLILARGCHLYPCSSYFAVDSDRFLYSMEKKRNFQNILKLLFELPIDEASPNVPATGGNVVQPSQPLVSIPTKPPTSRPTTAKTPRPVTSVSNPPTVLPITAEPTDPRVPTGSPIELSDITQLNDGETHVINKETSFLDESIVVTKNTTILLERGGYIEAPLNTNWPAVRLSIGSSITGLGGAINGSYADPSFLEGEYEDGGDGVHINNGQASDVTGSKGVFYDGVVILGGDAPVGVGGDALYVNGFGSEAKIYGGSFIGGKGVKGEGYSILVQNSAKVHVYSGSFDGEIKVDRNAEIIFYGCFKRDRFQVSGTFADETTLDVSIRTSYGGEVTLTAVSEQECETAPSISPTFFPTISPRPTPKFNHGGRSRVSVVLLSLSLASVLLVGLF